MNRLRVETTKTVYTQYKQRGRRIFEGGRGGEIHRQAARK